MQSPLAFPEGSNFIWKKINSGEVLPKAIIRNNEALNGEQLTGDCQLHDNSINCRLPISLRREPKKELRRWVLGSQQVSKIGNSLSLQGCALIG